MIQRQIQDFEGHVEIMKSLIRIENTVEMFGFNSKIQSQPPQHSAPFRDLATHTGVVKDSSASFISR